MLSTNHKAEKNDKLTANVGLKMKEKVSLQFKISTKCLQRKQYPIYESQFFHI